MRDWLYVGDHVRADDGRTCAVEQPAGERAADHERHVDPRERLALREGQQRSVAVTALVGVKA